MPTGVQLLVLLFSLILTQRRFTAVDKGQHIDDLLVMMVILEYSHPYFGSTLARPKYEWYTHADVIDCRTDNKERSMGIVVCVAVSVTLDCHDLEIHLTFH